MYTDFQTQNYRKTHSPNKNVLARHYAKNMDLEIFVNLKQKCTGDCVVDHNTFQTQTFQKSMLQYTCTCRCGVGCTCDCNQVLKAVD